MSELAQPIEQQILMCDSREEILMMACVMLLPMIALSEAMMVLPLQCCQS